MAYTTINKSSDHFNTVLYTGDGSASDRTITNVGFKPDWLWNKSRSNAYNHYIFDVLRGTNMIGSNASTQEEDKSPQFSAFTSDVFTITNDAGSLAINASGVTFANWCWKANGAGVSNTDGSITSTVSANTTSGFSVVTYSGNSTAGATIGHGLGVAPEIVFYKATTAAFDWLVYSKALGATKELVLNSTAAGTTSSVFNNQDPTSTNLIVNTNSGNNSSSHSYVAYCFAPKKGFSKFGSYVGNGSADGTFVYTGFKPAMIIFKNTTTSGTSWTIYDNKRDTYNVTNHLLLPSGSDPEISANSTLYLDFLSNGFKMRGANSTFNTSGDTYIYMAFAEEPLVGTNNIPATAR